jgi:septum formation protein
VLESGISEDFAEGTPPDAIVMNLSRLKAEAVGRNVDNGFIIGADTIVVLENEILGKPASSTDAVTMLRKLSGRTHFVYTGFTVIDVPSGRSVSDYEKTAVTFRQLQDDEILRYVDSGSPLDKAGAYGIQDDFGAVFVERIEGCFYTVVGFPLEKFYVTFQQFQQQLTM